MEYDNTNRGILSRNERRESDNHAEYTGTINVAGTEYWLSAWVKTRKDGSGKFFSLSVKEKDAKKPEPRKQSSRVEEMTDDIPF